MERRTINQIIAILPIAMSLLALLLVLVVVATGWERNERDEGAAAHIFQLLIFLQVPFIVAFLATADWHPRRRVIVPLTLQAIALVAAFGSVAFFKL